MSIDYILHYMWHAIWRCTAIPSAGKTPASVASPERGPKPVCENYRGSAPERSVNSCSTSTENRVKSLKLCLR